MQYPSLNEYSPFFQRYISLEKEGDFLEQLDHNTKMMTQLFENIPADKQNYRYAEGKWTIKEVLMHITDTERVMCYRAWVIARQDHQTVLYNMDQDQYASHVDVSQRTMESLVKEFIAVRNATAVFFEYLTDDESKLVGTASGNPVSPRALGYIILGHAHHHMNMIVEQY